MKSQQLIVWALAGFLMSLGMSFGGMAHVSSLNFFDPFRTGVNQIFDFSMLLLFCAALIPTFLYWQLIGKRTTPWLAESWSFVTNNVIDRKLVLGSAIFGAGWALGGFCPGPSVSGLVTGHPNFVAFSYGLYAYFAAIHLLNTRNSEGERHWALTVLLGLVPVSLYFVGPIIFSTNDLGVSVSWPISASLLGGLGIAIATIMMFQFNGRSLGVCGIWNNILNVEVSASARLPQLLFFGAFMAGGVVVQMMSPESFASPPHEDRNLVWIFIGGVLVAMGTTWANGCTSGHGISGAARLSVRSLVAVPTFMAGVFIFLPIFNIVLGV
ncbi:MAG: YeeE/YedE thiosulfate transporter family protein [Paracoccaceae bacterium]|jgi:uncharacterized protein|nr:YeeE/YedE thiosulfate transporter family protein [Paracoccaceae bacterium]